MIHWTTSEKRSRFLTSLQRRNWIKQILENFDPVNLLFLPEDTHALFGVPVVEELQAGNGEKLENK